MGEDEITIARERIRLAEANIEQQRALIADLKLKGQSALLADELLHIFEDALRFRQAYLYELLKK